MKTNTSDEARLLKAWKGGDDKAFDEIYHQYHPRLYGFTLRMVKSREVAEELVQDVFMKVWNNRQQTDEDRCFQSYVYTLTKHHLFNHLRKQQPRTVRLQETLLSPMNAHNETEQGLINADYEAFYQRALATLPPQKRQIFELNRHHGMSYQEIARTMRIYDKTIEFHMRGCLKMFRQYLRTHADVRLVAGRNLVKASRPRELTFTTDV